MYGQGISRTGEVLDLAVDLEIVKKGGSWFSYKDQKLGQGRDNVKEVLKNDEALMKEIEEQILARKDELQAIAPKKEKKSKKSGKNTESEFSDDYSDSSEMSEENGDSMDSSDILADIEEDFEEFTPVDE